MQLPEFLQETTPESIRLADHRIGLEHVVHYYNQGFSPEMLLGQFPSLSLPLIHKVIAFYLEHQAFVDAYVAASQVEVDRQRAAGGSPDLAEMRRRMAQLSRVAS